MAAEGLLDENESSSAEGDTEREKEKEHTQRPLLSASALFATEHKDALTGTADEELTHSDTEHESTHASEASAEAEAELNSSDTLGDDDPAVRARLQRLRRRQRHAEQRQQIAMQKITMKSRDRFLYNQLARSQKRKKDHAAYMEKRAQDAKAAEQKAAQKLQRKIEHALEQENNPTQPSSTSSSQDTTKKPSPPKQTQQNTQQSPRKKKSVGTVPMHADVHDALFGKH